MLSSISLRGLILTKWFQSKGLFPLFLGLMASIHTLAAHATPPPPPPDLSQLPRVKAELDRDLANAGDNERVAKEVYKGDILWSYGDVADAEASYQVAVATARRLYANAPASIEALCDLIYALSELGDFELGPPDAASETAVDKALVHYREALTLARRLVSADRRSDRANRVLVSCLVRMGRAQQLGVHHDHAALMALQEGLTVSRAMASQYPTSFIGRYYWQDQIIDALVLLVHIPNSGVGPKDYMPEIEEKRKDMKENGIFDDGMH
jgi:tetratricopeptide (TPR) repeat protein